MRSRCISGDIPTTVRLPVAPSDMLLEIHCDSGQLTELRDLSLSGSMAGSIPTEM
jgi:hypothetical protein